ncbi:general secretion pathway protein GspK [Diaphorobacter sp. HDW4B]|uniref:general secretion pathway protein GspK n=1 Tax=Diaphorobacter sp. HDW4B TaxID=2714925 RepID=UPI00140A421D|nr:type II secretion system protein GspK [Diaphorobacter sp. HDW4B]QIL70229.1 general secretion pathway protein GspK [Diaphorobacter sp. HDW4B]
MMHSDARCLIDCEVRASRRYGRKSGGQVTRQQRGFALIAVLWLVAALSVMVGGLMLTVKSELKTASFSRQTLQASATGEAAIQVALQGVVASGKPPAQLISAPVPVFGQSVDVQMIPMNGYIDLNRAPLELLQAVFQLGAGLDAGSAGSLVEAINAARTVPGPSGKPPNFESPEDLLLLPGVDYALYSRVAPLVTTDAGGNGKVNIKAAPPSVLAVIAGGDQAAVNSFIQARSEENPTVDTTKMNGAWVDQGTANSNIEFTARVALPDGDAITVVRRYTITPNSPNGLPWRPFYASSRVESALKP